MNDELWFFRSAKILDKEFVNLNDYFRLMIIFVLKIYFWQKKFIMTLFIITFLTIHNSPFTLHNSPFTIHHS